MHPEKRHIIVTATVSGFPTSFRSFSPLCFGAFTFPGTFSSMFIHSTDINVMAGSLGWLPVDDTLDRQSSSLLAPWTWRPTIHTPANTTTLFHPTPPFVQFETPKTPTLTGTARARAPASLGKESTHIPRPSNAFILFRAHLSRSSKEKGWDHIALSQNAGQAWHQLPPDEKQVFYDQAAKLKQQHALMNPTYRYNPVRKGKRTRRKSESYATPLFPTWNSISEPAKPIRRPRAASAPGKIISLRPSITIATGVEMTSEPSFQAKVTSNWMSMTHSAHVLTAKCY